MPYQLKRDEPLSSGLKRISDEQVASAIEQLQAFKIFEVRKSIKKLRSALGLLRPYLGPAYIEENRRLRDVARRFSAQRDVEVSVELIESFAGAYKRKSTLNPQRKALSEKQNAVQPTTAAIDQSVESLNGIRKRIEDWPLTQITRDDLELQIKKSHKESRRAYRVAVRTRTPANLHELRKSIKRELNQLRLLKAADNHIEELKQLATLLGDHHNLVVLEANLENASARFRQMLRRRLKQYDAEIFTRAAFLYEEDRRQAVA